MTKCRKEEVEKLMSATDKVITEAKAEARKEMQGMTKKELKYVNSLKEENERIKNMLIRFVDALGKLHTLDDAVNISLIPLMTEENKRIREEIKAEARKEFAERLKEKCYDNLPFNISVRPDDIDKVLEETENGK